MRNWVYWWLALVLLTLLLGIWGYRHRDGCAWPDAIYQAVQLFVLNYQGMDRPGWQLEIARWLAPILAVFGFWRWVVTQLLQQLEQQALSSHSVICGLGRKGSRFAGRFRQMGCTVVAIEVDAANPRIKACRNQGIRVLVGGATENKVLETAKVEQADRIFCLCGDSRELEADVLNDQVADQIERRVGRSRPATKGELQCPIHARNLEWLGRARGMAKCLVISPTRRYHIVPLSTLDDGGFQFPPEDLERIAGCEHQRYLDSQGWRDLGHPAMQPWELLGDKYKAITREQVAAWPSILARVGLGLELQ